MIIGIDPGLGGAIAVLDPQSRRGDLHDMPVMAKGRAGKRQVDAGALHTILAHINARALVLESVSARPGQGVTSMFSLGDSYGVCRSVAACLEIPLYVVPSAKWKRQVGLDANKDRSIAMARERFPHLAGRLGRKKDHGRAEALLLAEWFATRYYQPGSHESRLDTFLEK